MNTLTRYMMCDRHLSEGGGNYAEEDEDGEYVLYAESAARIENLERDCRSYAAMAADAIHRMDAALVEVSTAQRQARFWQNAYEEAAIQLLAIKTNLTAIIEDY